MSAISSIIFIVLLVFGLVLLFQGSIVLGGFLLLSALGSLIFVIAFFIMGRFKLIPAVRIVSVITTVIYFIGIVTILSIVGIIIFMGNASAAFFGNMDSIEDWIHLFFFFLV